MNHRPAVLAILAVAAFTAPARAEVTTVEIARREPYAGGRSFGTVGPYEHLTGTVRFAVDPKAKANRSVVDLALAPRNGSGRVEFAADLEILAPVDRNRGNGTLLYDVNNRGGQTAAGMFNGGADEFLMRQGYTVVSSGWIAETHSGQRLYAPIADNPDGSSVVGKVRAEMVPDAPATRLNIAHWANQGSYAPTARGLDEATLTERVREKDPRVPIPHSEWHLEAPGNSEDSSLQEAYLVLDRGFRPGHIYELIYEARDPVVQGLGLAGIRDLVSFLKHDRTDRNPLRRTDGVPSTDRAIGFGVSQSGRALRMLVYDGFNADEQGKIVFDGLFPHVAGAGLGFFNHRFASPTRHNAQHDNHLFPADVFPFTYGDEKDPFTKRTDGILHRARQQGAVPKVFHTQTSAEYWSRSGSLVHTDALGRRDAVIPPEVRIYAIGGAQHGPGSGIAGRAGSGQLPANPTDYRPILRALLTDLNNWVRNDTPPPPSVYPHIADGTLVDWREGPSGWKSLPGVRYPEVIQQPEYLNHGPEFLTKRRLTVLPPEHLGDYRVLAPAYGPDDNNRGMLLLPSIAAPVATYTGWNLRSPSIGAPTELLSLTGSYIPFPLTPADRERAGDPRPALLERYPTFDVYLSAFEAAMKPLARERYLLPEDEPRLRELAERFRPLWSPPLFP